MEELIEYRVGVDVGGTNTDFVLLNERTNEVKVLKVPSTTKAPEEAVIRGIERMGEMGIRPDRISFFSHGTTIATNALIEQKGAKVGLLITEGFRGLFRIIREISDFWSHGIN